MFIRLLIIGLSSAVPASNAFSRPHSTKPMSGAKEGSPNALLESFDGEIAADGSGNLGVIDEMNKTDTNPNSIVQLLVWKAQDDDENDDPSPMVALYTGGDAEYIMEKQVANSLDGQQISVYKGGHHGS